MSAIQPATILFLKGEPLSDYTLTEITTDDVTGEYIVVLDNGDQLTESDIEIVKEILKKQERMKPQIKKQTSQKPQTKKPQTPQKRGRIESDEESDVEDDAGKEEEHPRVPSARCLVRTTKKRGSKIESDEDSDVEDADAGKEHPPPPVPSAASGDAADAGKEHPPPPVPSAATGDDEDVQVTPAASGDNK